MGERRPKDTRRWSKKGEDEGKKRREEKRREIASLSSSPKLWHRKARSTMRRRRALVDLFGVVEMLIGERIRPVRVPLLQVFSA